MSDTKLRNGGPAFPHRSETVLTENGGIHIHSRPIDLPGMTLRDYFAAKAMAAAYLMHMDGTRNVDRDAEALSNEAYAIADAMLEAREQ